MKLPRRIEYQLDQAAFDRDGRQQRPTRFKDEVDQEKHRRFHYLRRRQEEERENRDNQ